MRVHKTKQNSFLTHLEQLLAIQALSPFNAVQQVDVCRFQCLQVPVRVIEGKKVGWEETRINQVPMLASHGDKGFHMFSHCNNPDWCSLQSRFSLFRMIFVQVNSSYKLSLRIHPYK